MANGCIQFIAFSGILIYLESYFIWLNIQPTIYGHIMEQIDLNMNHRLGLMANALLRNVMKVNAGKPSTPRDSGDCC